MSRKLAKLVLLLIAAAATWSSSFLVADAGQLEPVHAASASCLGRERDALLEFKQGINDTEDYLVSWQQESQDCCRWAGITCSNTTRHVIQLDLGQYPLDGQISPSLISLEQLEYLNFNQTQLSGPNGGIPEFLGSFKNLRHLDLSQMYFTGTVPPQLGNLSKLEYLDLSNSRMYSKDVSWLTRIPRLVHLDMSDVNLSSISADWPLVVNMLPSLEYLGLSYCSLQSTNRSLTHLNLTNLQHLDLSSNYFAMAQKHPKRRGLDMSTWYTGNVGTFREVWSVVMKRQELKYGSGVFDVVSIDLSLNHLVGGIPEGVTSLNGVLNLNLSWNHLSGRIPGKIGSMKSIESLDLSRNNLTGEVPSSLSNFTYLSFLDLSYNNLEGRIPPGAQLDTLYMENPSIYTGNIGLCGPPLQRNCSGDNPPEDANRKTREKVYEPVLFLYFGLGSGFVAGLWVVFCVLLFKRAWRISFFRLLDKVYDNAYVFVVVAWGRINDKTTS
ncbi:unnamed protein product [Alopecurus aequalis]